VPSFKVKAGTQKADIKDWQAAGQAGVYKFGDKTEFNLKYGKTEEAMDKFTVDAGKTGLDLNFVENTFVNQRNFQNILDGKNPVFDHNPFPEWVPSTGELTDYYDWTDYAKQYTKEKYTINNELPTKNTPKGGVAGYKGEFVDLGSSKLYQDRQDEFLIKYADAKTSDGASVPSEMLENTHWNLESFKRLKEGKKPLGNYNGNPVTEWVPSTGELKAYKDWDDYADQYSVSKYTSKTTTPVIDDVRNDGTTLPTVQQIKDMGGYTHGIKHTKGYLVSLPNYEYKVPASECTDKHWAKHFIKVRAELSVKANKYLGAWFNPEDDNFYFDLSQWVETKDEALVLGKEHNQLSIYELGTGNCIRL
jgi:hypothetical protein